MRSRFLLVFGVLSLSLLPLKDSSAESLCERIGRALASYIRPDVPTIRAYETQSLNLRPLGAREGRQQLTQTLSIFRKLVRGNTLTHGQHAQYTLQTYHLSRRFTEGDLMDIAFALDEALRTRFIPETLRENTAVDIKAALDLKIELLKIVGNFLTMFDPERRHSTAAIRPIPLDAPFVAILGNAIAGRYDLSLFEVSYIPVQEPNIWAAEGFLLPGRKHRRELRMDVPQESYSVRAAAAKIIVHSGTIFNRADLAPMIDAFERMGAPDGFKVEHRDLVNRLRGQMGLQSNSNVPN